MERAERAREYFKQGYACSQAVAMAFSDLTTISEADWAKLTLPFGGGLGRLRLTCGAVSGMFLVVGALYGYDDPKATTVKRELYAQVQEMANQFRGHTGSIVCRDLLQNPATDPNPSPRTAEYYSSRPCVRMVETAAQVLEAYIQTHPLNQ